MILSRDSVCNFLAELEVDTSRARDVYMHLDPTSVTVEVREFTLDEQGQPAVNIDGDVLTHHYSYIIKV